MKRTLHLPHYKNYTYLIWSQSSLISFSDFVKHPIINKILYEMTEPGLKATTTEFINEHWTIFPSWPNNWPVFWVLICTVHLAVCSCGLESSCINLNFRFRTCFEQGLTWHSGNCRVWIHWENRKWHDRTYSQYNILPRSYLSQHPHFSKQAKTQVNMAAVKSTINSAITRDNKIPLKSLINLWE